MKFGQKIKLIFQICFRKQRLVKTQEQLTEILDCIYEGLYDGLIGLLLLMALPFLLIYKVGQFVKPLFWELFVWDNQKFEETKILFNKSKK